MHRTGIFFHYQQGERLKDFPEALGNILEKENVVYYDAKYELSEGLFQAKPVPEELLTQVHDPEMIRRVKQTEGFEGALYSAGGAIQAGELIFEDAIDNAFVFTGYGDHHAGRNNFGGGCYLNSAALSIANLREKYGVRKFAIVDTDAHHGDGTWELFEDDSEVLYLCFCRGRFPERNNNVNITVPWQVDDELYLSLVEREFLPRVERHKPELIFWNYGYDGTRGEYGDMGLSENCHPRLAKIFTSAAEQVCRGRLITVLCGGSSRSIATYTIPKIIACLAGLG